MQNESSEQSQGIIKIPDFTLDDYLSPEGTPYKWICEHGSHDAYTFTRLKMLMAPLAKDAGVRNFLGMFNAYLKSHPLSGGDANIENTEVTKFAGQPFEFDCGAYVCDDSGVSVPSPFGGMMTVCAHPIMPVKRLVNIDTGEVKLEIAYCRGEQWRREVFDKDTLSNARSIVKLAQYGISVTSESAKELVKFIAFIEDANYDRMPVEYTVDHLGWVNDMGFSPYIDGLSYDNGGKFNGEFKNIHPDGDADEWFRLAKAIRAGRGMEARIILATAFASVLVKPLDALPFIVHLWGSVSGSGKSVAMQVAASVWGNPAIGNGYVKQLNGTLVGLEQSAAFCGNIPLALDELQLIQDNRKNFDQLIYMLCEGSTKMRGSRTGGLQRTLKWANAIMTTGEQPITATNSRSGAINRVIELECGDHVFDGLEARYVSQTVQSTYGHAGKMFVEALMQDGMMDTMREVHESIYSQLKDTSCTDKHMLSASIILTADYMADKLLFHDSRVLTVDDILPYLLDKETADINRNAYDWLMDWASQNANKFVPITGETYQGECWGRYANAEGKACLDGQEPSLLCVIKSVFDAAMAQQGYNSKAFLSWAGKRGLLDTNGKRDTKVVRFGVTMARCVCIRIRTETQQQLQEVKVDANELPF